MNIRVTVKLTSPSLNLPSSILVSPPPLPLPPLPPVETIVPVSLSPSSLSLRVVSRFWPPNSLVHFQVPVGSFFLS
jgi:hypothetical protein